MIYPWQVRQWQQLWQVRTENRLPHALLLAGIAGTGKMVFAEHFVRALLCANTTTDGQTCGTCHACRLIAGNTHPNVLRILPEKEGQAIKVDQIREASEVVSQSSLQGEYRIVIIHPANAMNANAANALLKTLEEPASGAIVLLISDQSARLPATILSRCQKIIFSAPAAEIAQQWLAEQSPAISGKAALLLRLTQGAPLAAQRLAEDEGMAIRAELYQSLSLLSAKKMTPLKLAASLQKNEPLSLIDFLLSFVADLLRVQLQGDADGIRNHDYQAMLLELKSSSMPKNINFMRYLQQVRKQLLEGINFNKQLLLESLFIRWTECF